LRSRVHGAEEPDPCHCSTTPEQTSPSPNILASTGGNSNPVFESVKHRPDADLCTFRVLRPVRRGIPCRRSHGHQPVATVRAPRASFTKDFLSWPTQPLRLALKRIPTLWPRRSCR